MHCDVEAYNERVQSEERHRPKVTQGVLKQIDRVNDLRSRLGELRQPLATEEEKLRIGLIEMWEAGVGDLPVTRHWRVLLEIREAEPGV